MHERWDNNNSNIEDEDVEIREPIDRHQNSENLLDLLDHEMSVDGDVVHNGVDDTVDDVDDEYEDLIDKSANVCDNESDLEDCLRNDENSVRLFNGSNSLN
jgi:uncharacterized protein YeeX (DUF496 family)